MDALLIKEIDSQNEIPVLQYNMETVKDPKTHKDVEQADYELIVIRKAGEGDDWYLSRRIIFSRDDLLPHRQLIYDVQGALATDARYDNFTNYEGILFPAIVQIIRPIENYSLQLSITKLTLNKPLKDEQFTLNQPPGSKLINLDQKEGNTAEVNGSGQEAPKPMH
jgi:outer membrane lipoprotein-sorting protein